MRAGGRVNPAGHRPRESLDIRGQGRVVLLVVGGVVADDVDYGCRRFSRVVQVCQPIGQARTKMQQRRRRRFGHAPVTVGHARHRALEQAQNHVHPLDLVGRGHEMHLRDSRVGETRPDSTGDQGAHQAFSTVHSSIPFPHTSLDQSHENRARQTCQLAVGNKPVAAGQLRGTLVVKHSFSNIGCANTGHVFQRDDYLPKPVEERHVSPQVTETEFTCKLITIRTKKSFTEVTGALESVCQTCPSAKAGGHDSGGRPSRHPVLFQRASLATTEFSIFFQLDQGSTQRLAGLPVQLPVLSDRQCGHCQRSFRVWRNGRARRPGAGVHLAERRGGRAHRCRRANGVLQSVSRTEGLESSRDPRSRSDPAPGQLRVLAPTSAKPSASSAGSPIPLASRRPTNSDAWQRLNGRTRRDRRYWPAWMPRLTSLMAWPN